MARTSRVPAALTAFALAGWVASALMMRSTALMDGPASLVSFLWLWIAMSAAMMLPSLVPAASLVGHVGRSCTVFVGGYFAVWAATGLLVFEAARGLAGVARWLSVAAIVLAATYQLTPLKRACLRRCRSPLGSLLRRGAFRAGLEHGLVCLGCCWALTLALVALGVGSMFAMAGVTAAILLEKVTSVGQRASVPIALALVGAAAWVAL